MRALCVCVCVCGVQVPFLRALATSAKPDFIEPDDFLAGVPIAGMQTTEADGCVCWVSSAGSLTPLHYDLNDGLLAQALGDKRVWLFHPKDRSKLALRSAKSPGENNWERQSCAELHGAHGARAFPRAAAATRWLAEIGPGEMLYIPAGWLHEVHTLAPSFSLGWRIDSNAVIARVPTEEAEAAHRRALAAIGTRGDPSGEERRHLLGGLAKLLYTGAERSPDPRSRYAQSEAVWRELLTAQRAALGPAHEDTLQSMCNHALALENSGKAEEAIDVLREARAGMRASGSDICQLWLRGVNENLGLLLIHAGEAREGAAMLREALASWRTSVGFEQQPKYARLRERLRELGEMEIDGDSRPRPLLDAAFELSEAESAGMQQMVK